MTEAEWLACDDPVPMLAWLGDKASARKLRLFAVACVRTAFNPMFEGETVHHALRVGRRLLAACERYADGAAGDQELAAARAEAEGVLRTPHAAEESFDWQVRCALRAAGPPEGLPEQLVVLRAEYAHYRAGRWTFYGGAAEVWQQYHDETLGRASRQQCQLLRDIVGNPFRPVTVAPAWRTADVVRLAEAAYEQRSLPAGTHNGENALSAEGSTLAEALRLACGQARAVGMLAPAGEREWGRR